MEFGHFRARLVILSIIGLTGCAQPVHMSTFDNEFVRKENSLRLMAGTPMLSADWKLVGVEHGNTDLFTYERGTSFGKEVKQVERSAVHTNIISELDMIPSGRSYTSPEDGEGPECLVVTTNYATKSRSTDYLGARKDIQELARQYNDFGEGFQLLVARMRK